MTDPREKRLRMIAGPNGSGKSSIIRGLSKEWNPDRGLFWLNHYLNADDVERFLLGVGLDLEPFDIGVSLTALCDALRAGGRLGRDHTFFREATLDGSVLRAPRADGYLAAAIVDFLRGEFIRRSDSFSFETVMSHPQKVEEIKRARAAGYKTYLYFVCTNSADLNVARVSSRVARGGHDVQEAKIRERYTRSLGLVRQVLPHAYRAYFFDNSGPEPVWLAEFDPDGKFLPCVEPAELPVWFCEWVLLTRRLSGVFDVTGRERQVRPVP